MKLKKFVSFAMSITILNSSLCACNNQNASKIAQTSSSIENSISISNSEKLINLMTEKEKDSVSVGNITLLERDEVESTNIDGVAIEWWNKNDYIEWWTNVGYEKYCKQQGSLSEEEYQNIINDINKVDDNVVNARMIQIDGREYYGFTPPFDYDGGVLEYTIGSWGKSSDKTVSLNSFDEFKIWYREYCNQQVTEEVLLQEEADQDYSDMLIVFQSVIDKTYSNLEKGTYDSIYGLKNFKSSWEFNYDEVAEIQDSIKEISIYDEELDASFVVHVTLPPNFNQLETYPVFVMTDGIWRFGNHPALRNMMNNDEVDDVILVSIGCDFKLDGTDNAVRAKYFCEGKELFLNFITDNLMPYLSEMYKIDFSHSGLYGHSLGGVFTHYAVFNSDKYDNQPFQYYIIGSPAFWSPYFLSSEENPDAYKSEYEFFDKNDALNKVLYICGGENEDADYAEYYGENDSTLKGISNLMDRLENYGVNSAECEIYDNSNHYEYIPDMFKNFFIKFYGK